ncbi:MAG: RNA polymerase sigma factor [Myxococcaceae bacterium]|nr:RNA polymerase sigma factor [Myxococcaceae bacterium]
MSDGIRQAWQRYFSPVREKCRRVLGDGDDASDVAQETFIRFWKQGPPEPPRVALAWLYRTATHLSVDRLRHRALHARAVPQPVYGADLEASTASRQLLARLARDADAEELQAAVLSRLDGLTHPEIAEVMDVSERTVRRLLARFDQRAQREESPP